MESSPDLVATDTLRPHGDAGEVFAAFLKLGLTSFGGPVAHLGYFREEFVARRRWIDEAAYADIVALCQFLPGPASSQVGMAIGLSRAGWKGALAAWAGFTIPSAILLVVFAYGVTRLSGLLDAGWLHGLKAAAIAVVTLAVISMARSLAPDLLRMVLVIIGAGLVLLLPGSVGQIACIGFGALAGLLFLRRETPRDHVALPVLVSRPVAIASLCLFFALLAVLPVAAAMTANHGVDLFDAFYRTGSLVFGGGHVVLPLLHAEVVAPGWLGNDSFLAGYGAAQAVPGPLFTFAAYLGVAMEPQPNGVIGAAICIIAIFLPSLLLIVGVLPFWDDLRKQPLAQAALRGVNATVVGLLLAALYGLISTAGLSGAGDYAIAACAFLLLYFAKAPPWVVVILSAVSGALIAQF